MDIAMGSTMATPTNVTHAASAKMPHHLESTARSMELPVEVLSVGPDHEFALSLTRGLDGAMFVDQMVTVKDVEPKQVLHIVCFENVRELFQEAWILEHPSQAIRCRDACGLDKLVRQEGVVLELERERCHRHCCHCRFHDGLVRIHLLAKHMSERKLEVLVLQVNCNDPLQPVRLRKGPDLREDLITLGFSDCMKLVCCILEAWQRLMSTMLRLKAHHFRCSRP
mmetsp:Transcript_123548/g.311162  ORF Transcript_123548/g.311162 Transcript_123548/m.311162 type:complete len:225 (-) Transcript_123548:587-1261(-)